MLGQWPSSLNINSEFEKPSKVIKKYICTYNELIFDKYYKIKKKSATTNVKVKDKLKYKCFIK